LSGPYFDIYIFPQQRLSLKEEQLEANIHKRQRKAQTTFCVRPTPGARASMQRDLLGVLFLMNLGKILKKGAGNQVFYINSQSLFFHTNLTCECWQRFD
jgi:hypothetical protein